MDNRKRMLQVRCEYGSQRTLEELIAQSFVVFCRSVLQNAGGDTHAGAAQKQQA